MGVSQQEYPSRARDVYSSEANNVRIINISWVGGMVCKSYLSGASRGNCTVKSGDIYKCLAIELFIVNLSMPNPTIVIKERHGHRNGSFTAKMVQTSLVPYLLGCLDWICGTIGRMFGNLFYSKF